MEEKKAKVCIEKCWRYLKHMAPHFSFLYIRSWLVCDHMYFFLTLSILVITDQVQKEKKKKKYLQEKIACTLSYKLFLFQNIKVEIGRYKD